MLAASARVKSFMEVSVFFIDIALLKWLKLEQAICHSMSAGELAEFKRLAATGKFGFRSKIDSSELEVTIMECCTKNASSLNDR
jgi:hypothetical protein